MSADALPPSDQIDPSAPAALTRPTSALAYLSTHHPTLIPVHIVSSHAYIWRVSDVSTLRDMYHICGLLTGTLPLIPQQNAFLGLPLQLFREEVTFLLRKRAVVLIDDEAAFDLPPTHEELQLYNEAYEADRHKQQQEIVRNFTQGKTAQIEKLLREQQQQQAVSTANSRTDAAADASSSRKGGIAASQSKDAEDATQGVPAASGKQDELLKQALEKRLLREERRRIASVQAHLQQQQQQQAQAQAEEAAADSAGSSENRPASIDAELGCFFAPDTDNATAAAAASAPKTCALDGQVDATGSSASRATKGNVDNDVLASSRAFTHLTIGSALDSPFPTAWYRPHLGPRVDHCSSSSSFSSSNGGKQPRAGGRMHTLLSTARASGLWTYPRTRAERARCAVFEDLQARGYFTGLGLRFGGDFVVYPGDPLRFHSHFTATVKLGAAALTGEGEQQQPISAMEIVANGRLGTAVKKAHLVSFAHEVRSGTDPDQLESGLRELWEKEDSVEYKWGEVEHLSLTWAGFGT